MIFGCYKNYLYTNRYKLSSEKKKQVKSLSIWFRTLKPVRIRQSGRTGNRGMSPSEQGQRQDRGASSHKERIAEYAPTYAFTPLFWTLIFCKKNLNSEHLFF